ncbi:hypothetical protein ACQKNS_17880 [Peribacillus sp. NPDC094092]|uniref:GntT/GntP/DsdX family permease n=1 Tax=Peribacillus sp. NPDC094092 TaxID=3390611 RepID=UPI003CFF2133
MLFFVKILWRFHFTLGCARGFNKEELSQFMAALLAPAASIILIIGAGGADWGSQDFDDQRAF